MNAIIKVIKKSHKELGGESMTDTNKLRKKIEESGLKYKYLAKSLGLTYFGLQKKINNDTEFKASEITTLCKILNINSPQEKESIFFKN